MLTKLFAKTILYRIYSIGIAFLVFWMLFGDYRTATGYALTLELIKVLQYYCFEVIWHRIPVSWFKADIGKSGVIPEPVVIHNTVPNESTMCVQSCYGIEPNDGLPLTKQSSK